MSTSPDRIKRPEDRVISLLSRWLAGHIGTPELRRSLDELGTGELVPAEAEAVDELVAELRGDPPRAELERVVRETIEALALGV